MVLVTTIECQDLAVDWVDLETDVGRERCRLPMFHVANDDQRLAVGIAEGEQRSISKWFQAI